MNTVIIVGPSPSGKTRNAARFMAHYGCTSLHDGYEQPRDPKSRAFKKTTFVYGGLYLTNHIDEKRVPPDVTIVHIEDALKAIGGDTPLPSAKPIARKNLPSLRSVLAAYLRSLADAIDGGAA
jgi:hypothetical protein